MTAQIPGKIDMALREIDYCGRLNVVLSELKAFGQVLDAVSMKNDERGSIDWT